MKYKGYLSFKPMGSSSSVSSNEDLPVSMIMVDGGTSRLIKLSSTDDFSLISELEQARAHKNLIIYLGGTRDHRDMKAALDLTFLGTQRIFISVILTIERRLNGKLLDGIAIYEESATCSQPIPALNKTMMINLKLEDAQIFQGPVRKHFIPTILKEL